MAFQNADSACLCIIIHRQDACWDLRKISLIVYLKGLDWIYGIHAVCWALICMFEMLKMEMITDISVEIPKLCGTALMNRLYANATEWHI